MDNNRKFVCAALIALPVMLFFILTPSPQDTITVFAGSAIKPALEDAAEAFEEQSSVKVELHFGGSGSMLSKMKISKRGDVYIAGSPDFMERAIHEGVVEGEPAVITYLIPAIIVRADNSKHINTLFDLARKDVKIGIASPKSVAIGRYTAEIITASKWRDDIKANIVSEFESAAKATAAVTLGSVDATINWRVTANWTPRLKAVPIEVLRISYVSAGVAAESQHKERAREFINFLTSPAGREILEKHGYITEKNTALKANQSAVLGGVPVVKW
jgi:molybdate transport system substrate-binding protein